MSSERCPVTTPEERESAIASVALAIQRGGLAVIPTDTVYGIAADAFEPDAVAALLAAKGRGRDMPPPVLVSSASTLDALAADIPDWARALAEEFWPGALTLVCRQQASLQWDLGDTRGTVAIRMPDLELTRDIIDRTGPLAVSSANTTGSPAATDADQAAQMLGESVEVLVDAGDSPGGVASTIVDATSEHGRILREGAIDQAALDAVLAPLGWAFTDTGMRRIPVETVEGDVEGDAGSAESAAAPAMPTKAAAKKTPAKKTPAKKTPAKKTPAKKTAAKKTPAKKTAAKTTAAKKTAAKKTAAGTPAKKAAPRRSSSASAAAAAVDSASQPPDPNQPDLFGAGEPEIPSTSASVSVPDQAPAPDPDPALIEGGSESGPAEPREGEAGSR